VNRSKSLNGLNSAPIEELHHVLSVWDKVLAIGCVVITGSEKAFAAGADVKEMKDKTFTHAYRSNFLANWQRVADVGKPMIAVVCGFYLSGGCEPALMCDSIIAADTAKFGLPEITLGIIPGFSATQRLARAIGEAKAMEMILTGRLMEATEAERAGRVACVVTFDKLMEEALSTACLLLATRGVDGQASGEPQSLDAVE
jgi:enoyl-CoA hydratase